MANQVVAKFIDELRRERRRLRRRLVLFERDGHGALDEFRDIISISGSRKKGYIIEASIATSFDETFLDHERNALGEIVRFRRYGLRTPEEIFGAIQSAFSDERLEDVKPPWEQILCHFQLCKPALAKALSDSLKAVK